MLTLLQYKGIIWEITRLDSLSDFAWTATLLGSKAKAAALAMGAAVLLVAVGAACGGSGGKDSVATPSPTGATPDEGDDVVPQVSPSALFPPLEGPERTFRPRERTNYREHPDFQFPDPNDLPAPSDAQQGREFRPPESPNCPEGWEVYARPDDGFRICHPSDWRVDSEGYVNVGVDDKWFSVGLFRYAADGRQSAHVSVYVSTPFSQPATYLIACDQAYQVVIDGMPASLCPDFPGESPEAKVIAYHIRRGIRDYFINVVPYFEFDSAAEGYLTTWRQDDEETAIQIAHSFEFLELPPG